MRAGSSGFDLGRPFERRQMRGPESIEEVPYGLQSIGADNKKVTRALVSLGNQARAAQHAQVKRDRLLRHGYRLRDLADRARLVAHHAQDAAAVGIGECPQRRVEVFSHSSSGTNHSPYSNTGLYKRQLEDGCAAGGRLSPVVSLLRTSRLTRGASAA